jgi:hypothetical protein
LHLAHLIHVHERIQSGAWNPGEGAVDGESFAF